MAQMSQTTRNLLFLLTVYKFHKRGKSDHDINSLECHSGPAPVWHPLRLQRHNAAGDRMANPKFRLHDSD